MESDSASGKTHRARPGYGLGTVGEHPGPSRIEELHGVPSFQSQDRAVRACTHAREGSGGDPAPMHARHARRRSHGSRLRSTLRPERNEDGCGRKYGVRSWLGDLSAVGEDKLFGKGPVTDRVQVARQLEPAPHAVITAFVLVKAATASGACTARDGASWPFGTLFGLHPFESFAVGHRAGGHGLRGPFGVDLAEEVNRLLLVGGLGGLLWHRPLASLPAVEPFARDDVAAAGAIPGQLTVGEQSVDGWPALAGGLDQVRNRGRLLNTAHAALLSTDLVLSATFQSKQKSNDSRAATRRARSSLTHRSPERTRLK